MKSVRVAAIVILVGIGVALTGVPADAQQPPAVPTPTVPNPNWCPGAPSSPPPQILEPDVWNREWQRCMNLPGVAEDYNCGHLCRGALEVQWRARNAAPTAEQSPEWPAPTYKQQGPFRLKNGAWKFIAPLASPAPTPAPESSTRGSKFQDELFSLTTATIQCYKYPMNHILIASTLPDSRSPTTSLRKQNLTERTHR
jgi:hypothetical protein